jgi:hypothetical protein
LKRKITLTEEKNQNNKNQIEENITHHELGLNDKIEK